MTFARTGPTTESKNAENDPRKAIIELNSGTAMDTRTARVVKKTRWRMPKRRFHRPKWVPFGAIDSPSGLTASSSGAESGTSMPSRISIVAFSG